MQKLTTVDVIALILVVVGGLNWGIWGLTGNVNVVSLIFQGLDRLVYIVVGLAALYVAWLWMKLERK